MVEDVVNAPTPALLVDANTLGYGLGMPAAAPTAWSVSAISWALGATHAPASGSWVPLEESFEAPAFDSYTTPNAVGPGSGTAVSAGMGQAHTLGRLSVPQGWASAAPAMRLAAATEPAAADNLEDLFRPMPLFGASPLTAMPSRGEGGASKDRWRPPLLKLRPRNRSQVRRTQ